MLFKKWLLEKKLEFTKSLGGTLVKEETKKERLAICYGSEQNAKNREKEMQKDVCPNLVQNEDMRLDKCKACNGCPVQLKTAYKTHLFAWLDGKKRKLKDKKTVVCPDGKW